MTVSNVRIYWLGPATEPGLWAIDLGVGTKIARVDNPQIFDGVVTMYANPTAPPELRPRGWIQVTPDGLRGNPPLVEFTHMGERKCLAISEVPEWIEAVGGTV